MSERAANERRKIKKGPISGLAHAAVKADASPEGQGPAGKQPDPDAPAKDTDPQQADASQEGQGPAGKQPDPDIPSKDTVPQQADASQEGQGPAGKQPDPDIPSKDTDPQQADASQEGQGPAGNEPDQDTEPDRVNEIVEVLKRVFDSKEDPETAAGNLLAKQDARLMAFAAAYAKGEAERAQKTGELERALAADERFVNAMIEDSLAMKSREEAAEALRKIKKIYWDKLVGHMENALIDARNVLDDELRNVRLDLSRRFQALPDQIASPPTLRLRIKREKPLLAGALILGLALGSVFEITGETLWDSAAAVGREALRLSGPVLIPLRGGSGQ